MQNIFVGAVFLVWDLLCREMVSKKSVPFQDKSVCEKNHLNKNPIQSVGESYMVARSFGLSNTYPKRGKRVIQFFAKDMRFSCICMKKEIFCHTKKKKRIFR